MPKTKSTLAWVRSKLGRERSTAGDEVPVYTYEELDQSSNQIRLLRVLPSQAKSRKPYREKSGEVHCEIFHANLDDHPSYEALSYACGTESAPRHTIYLNECQLEIRDNLWHALNRFRSDNVPMVIWIDAMCIDQSSDRERNHQVAKMTMIFEQATEVVVWLGPSYDESHLAFQIVREL
jgi:hypothetical protein